MNLSLLLHPHTRAVLKRLDKLALHGDYNIDLLNQIKQSKDAFRCNATRYYLASLYLQCGDEESTTELLSGYAGASAEMKKYFQVLSFSIRKGYPIPELTRDEKSGIEYLDGIINPANRTLESCILGAGGFSIVGNAPGDALTHLPRGALIYFNDYKKNTRICNDATLHVVTPSWDLQSDSSSNVMCVTGNNIFFRRSRVWQRFVSNRNCKSLYTLPKSLWASLYRELGTSPSAGLLILAFVADIAARHPQELSGYVAGFSNGRPATNHHYDSTPASKRHNWELETVLRKRIIERLQKCCADFATQA